MLLLPFCFVDRCPSAPLVESMLLPSCTEICVHVVESAHQLSAAVTDSSSSLAPAERQKIKTYAAIY
jgi:hypothetical protein